jgi:hypothetical protein
MHGGFGGASGSFPRRAASSRRLSLIDPVTVGDAKRRRAGANMTAGRLFVSRPHF